MWRLIDRGWCRCDNRAIFARSATASTGAILTGIGVTGATSSVGTGGMVYKTLKEGVNFTQTTLARMSDAGRFVPVQTLIQAIKNGKAYNLEVLYDKVANTILHFLYK